MATALIDEKIGGTLWIIFVASWVIIGLGGFLYFRRNKNVKLKKRFHRWSVIAYATTFFFLIVLSGMPWVILLFFGAFIAVIAYLNIKNTIFCNTCGQTIYNYMWLSKIEYCAKCGAKLPDK